MATTWTLRVSRDGGAVNSGGIQAVAGEVITLSLDNTIGLTEYLWQIYDFPEGFACPASWTDNVDSAGVHDYRYTGSTPPDFTLDAALWGKYGLRFTGNGGTQEITVGQTTKIVADPDKIDSATAIVVPSANGLHGLMTREANQFSAEHSPPLPDWVAEINADLHLIQSQFTNLVIAGQISYDGGTSLTFSSFGAVSGAATDNVDIDTSGYGANALIEVAAMWFAIEDGGGQEARLKRTITMHRTAGTLAIAQAIATIGTDFDNTSGVTVGITASGDNIRLSFTGDGALDLNWVLKGSIDFMVGA